MVVVPVQAGSCSGVKPQRCTLCSSDSRFQQAWKAPCARAKLSITGDEQTFIQSRTVTGVVLRCFFSRNQLRHRDQIFSSDAVRGDEARAFGRWPSSQRCP